MSNTPQTTPAQDFDSIFEDLRVKVSALNSRPRPVTGNNISLASLLQSARRVAESLETLDESTNTRALHRRS